MVEYEEGVSQEDKLVLAKAEEYLIQTAQMGREIDDFLRTAPGRALLSRALQDVSTAIDIFLHEDIDTEEGLANIRSAKRAAHNARTPFTWLIDAVVEGQNNEEQLNEIQEPTGRFQ